jgi:hypothetical protein
MGRNRSRNTGIHFGLKPAESISDLVREIKNATNDYIKEHRFSPFKFDWQAGYGAFSYSRSHTDAERMVG